VGYCYPSGLEKTLCKWYIYFLLVTKGLRLFSILACIAVAIFRVDHKLTKALHAKTYNMAKLQKPEL
jgi:hypothetical protein